MKRLLMALLVPWMALAQAPIQRNPFTTNVTAGPIVSPADVTVGSLHAITNLTGGALDVTNNARFQNATGSKLAVFDGLKLLTNSVYSETDFQATNSVLTDLAGIGAGLLGQVIWNDGTRWTNAPDGSILLTGATTTGGITNSGLTVYTPSAVQTLAVGNTIAVNATTLRVAGSGGSVVLTSTPTIATNGIPDGSLVIVRGTSDANTVTLQDKRTLTGSCLALWAPQMTLANGAEAVFQFSVMNTNWQLKAFSPNSTQTMPFSQVNVWTNIVVGPGSVPQAQLTVGPSPQGTNALVVNGGAQTNASQPIAQFRQGWTNSGTAFKGVGIYITNAASASGSRPLEVYSGASGSTLCFDVDTGGHLTTGYLISQDYVQTAATTAFQWNGRSKLLSSEDGGMRIENSGQTSDRHRIYGTAKTTPMGATTGVVKIGLTGTPAAAATNCFVGGLVNYTIQNTHTGGAGVTNAIEVGNGTLRYNAVAVNDLGGGGRFVYVRLTDITNASWSVGANTFGWTWGTNAVDATSFTLSLTPTNTVVNRATTETCTVTYSVIQDAAQLVTPL